jgi:hypothetical protein
MRTGWLFVLGVGLLAASLRWLSPGSVADAAAMTYLFLATVTFGRPRRQPSPEHFRMPRDPGTIQPAHRVRSNGMG